jgi:excisionase family DNA binding protein
MNANDLNAAGHQLLSSREVAELLRISPATVSRWAKSGKLASLRTPGGHARFPRREVERVLRLRAWTRADHAHDECPDEAPSWVIIGDGRLAGQRGRLVTEDAGSDIAQVQLLLHVNGRPRRAKAFVTASQLIRDVRAPEDGLALVINPNP